MSSTWGKCKMRVPGKAVSHGGAGLGAVCGLDGGPPAPPSVSAHAWLSAPSPSVPGKPVAPVRGHPLGGVVCASVLCPHRGLSSVPKDLGWRLGLGGSWRGTRRHGGGCAERDGQGRPREVEVTPPRPPLQLSWCLTSDHQGTVLYFKPHRILALAATQQASGILSTSW